MVNEPVVPVPPLPDEEHEVLLVDVQEMVVLVLYAIEVDAAESVIVGVLEITAALEAVVVVEPPPPHEARPETANSIAKIILVITLGPTV